MHNHPVLVLESDTVIFKILKFVKLNFICTFRERNDWYAQFNLIGKNLFRERI